tara:strand:- start:587 stop:1183 length:597 start_codon:yes stop_codon:yes gene_type:complete
MAYIGRDPQYGAFEKQALTADGSTTTFTLDYTVGSSSSLLVSVAGVHQEPEVAYNLATNGTQITFTAAPASGDTVFVIFLGVALEVATVGSGVITSRTELAERAASDDVFLIYDTSATALKKIQASNVVKASVTRTGTGDGSTTTFTVTNGTTVDNVLVMENGVTQAPTSDYTISGTTLTFGTAPGSGVNIVVRELPA